MILNTITNFLPKFAPSKEKTFQTQPVNRNVPRASLMLSGFYSFDEQQQKMSRDIERYVLKSKRFDEHEIESIIQQYSPNTNFRETKNTGFEFAPTREINAQTIQKFEVLPKTGANGFKVHRFPQYVSAVFPLWNTKKERILFAARLIHEFTHVLQEDLVQSQAVIPLVEKFVENQKDLAKVDLTIEAASAIYEFIEIDMTHKLKRILKTSSNLPSRISSKTTLDWGFIRETRRNVENDLNHTFIQMYHQLQNTVNWNYIHDYISTRAHAEAVAYQKELDFLRKHTSIGSDRCDFDLKIELYEKIAASSTKLKLKNIKQKKPLK